MCNFSVSQIFLQNIFFKRENVGKFEVPGYRCTITGNEKVFAMAGYSLNVQPVQMLY
jgi:hypothetical protein